MKKNTIFVSIASYRDSMCNATISDLYKKAKYPENVFIGVCQQNVKENIEEKCDLDFDASVPKENIRVITIDSAESKGATFARYWCSTLYDDEEFFFQCDSHMLFVENWDVKCISMIHQIEDLNMARAPYTMLSTYPPDISEYDTYNESKKNTVTRICKFFFNSRGMLSQMGAEMIDSNGMPYKTPFVAGGFLFGYATMLKDVPFDPNLDFLFVGEEVLMSARLFTHGYEIFTPPEVVCFHYYTRPKSPKIWSDKTYSDIPAFKKAMGMLELDTVNTFELPDNITMNITKYGIGNVRSLKEFYDFIGADIANKKVVKNFCREGNIASDEDIQNSNENTISNTIQNTVKSISSYGLSHSRKMLCLLVIMTLVLSSLIMYIVYNYKDIQKFIQELKEKKITVSIGEYLRNLLPHYK